MYKNHVLNVFSMVKKYVANTDLLYSRILTRSVQYVHTRQISYTELMKSGSSVKQIRDDLRTIMGVEKEYKRVPKSRAHLTQYLPKDINALPTRSMADSYMTAIIPLSTDLDLQEKYITFLGTIRLGRILEDMDIFSVVVAMRYLEIPNLPEEINSPYTLVTAAVDRIDFSANNTEKDKDIRLSGHVTYVGRSSLEVVVCVEQQRDSEWWTINKSLFMLAARDPTATRAAAVNKLQTTTPEEELIFNDGLKRRELRKQWQAQDVRRVIPTQEEQQVLHDIYLKSIPQDININKSFVPSGCVRMDKAFLSNLVFSQPQDRNFHNRVFGGFLMRQAMELAWTTCYLYTKRRPHLKCIHDIAFKKPIPVHSLIRMLSYIAYTADNFVQITLYVETLDPISEQNATTNALHFTFELPTVVPEIIPITYQENMMYIDARRRFVDSIDKGESLLNFKPISDPNL